MSTDNDKEKLRKNLRVAWFGIPLFVLLTAYRAYSFLTNSEIPTWFNATLLLLCVAGLVVSIGGVIVYRKKLHGLG